MMLQTSIISGYNAVYVYGGGKVGVNIRWVMETRQYLHNFLIFILSPGHEADLLGVQIKWPTALCTLESWGGLGTGQWEITKLQFKMNPDWHNLQQEEEGLWILMTATETVHLSFTVAKWLNMQKGKLDDFCYYLSNIYVLVLPLMYNIFKNHYNDNRRIDNEWIHWRSWPHSVWGPVFTEHFLIS